MIYMGRERENERVLMFLEMLLSVIRAGCGRQARARLFLFPAALLTFPLLLPLLLFYLAHSQSADGEKKHCCLIWERESGCRRC